jgi:hypothetical protein
MFLFEAWLQETAPPGIRAVTCFHTKHQHLVQACLDQPVDTQLFKEFHITTLESSLLLAHVITPWG